MAEEGVGSFKFRSILIFRRNIPHVKERDENFSFRSNLKTDGGKVSIDHLIFEFCLRRPHLASKSIYRSL